MSELILIITIIFIGLLAGINETTYHIMVMIALVCIYYEIPKR